MHIAGSGPDCTLTELVLVVAKIVGHEGEILWDDSKPDGTLRKLLDIENLKTLGWSYRYSLEEGLLDAYR